MPHPLTILTRMRAIAALLVAVVVLQAMPAGPISTHLENGPAFSASTAQLALVSAREMGAEQRVVPQRPAPETLPPAVALVLVPVVVAAAAVVTPWPVPVATGPPPIDLRPSLAPRAPPAA